MKSLTSYLGEQETTLLAVRQHPLALTRAAREMATFVIPLLITAWGLAGVQLLRGPVADWGVRLCFALVLGFVLRMAWRVLQWEFERVVITDEKVIHIEGVLQRRIASTPLAKVSEFTVRQPLLGRIFGYGRLVVDVPGGRDQALHGLNFIPDPAGVYRMVSDLGRRGRAKEGGGSAAPVQLTGSGALVEAQPTSDMPTMFIDHLPDDASGGGARDPWRPTLDPDDADHTIQIPRVQ
ncbi:MAG: hypothetical protein JWN72_2780 [Thermoleophilia bacterium]|nr:hypothetical protein [Thermoleophilia bacterium]